MSDIVIAVFFFVVFTLAAGRYVYVLKQNSQNLFAYFSTLRIFMTPRSKNLDIHTFP